MPPEVINFIAHYGYIAIFVLVFSQEIGIPNPVPNELVLVFSGYLTYKSILSLPLVILTAVTADFSGTNILYFAFYFFGRYILKHKPRWLPISEKRIDALSSRLLKGGLWRIYLGRITPFIRGYTSVITGLLQVKPKIFLPIAFVSGLSWAAVCVTSGYILGPYWSSAGDKLAQAKIPVLVVAGTLIFFFFCRYLKKRYFPKKGS